MATPKLVNMKLDPVTEKEKYAEPSTLVESPRYPWGLCIDLDDEAMKRLKLAKMPPVGESVMVLAKATVTRCSENQYQNSDGKAETRQNCALQITDLALSDVDDESDAATALYKG